MSIDTKHPLYEEQFSDWEICRDLYKGESFVKAKSTTYLPSTTAMQIDGMSVGQYGYIAYVSYLKRAKFPTLFRDAVEAFIGLLHQQKPTITLPVQMEPMREKASSSGESLEMLLRKISEEQLITGRLGLHLDFPSTVSQTGTLPYISIYSAESIINWDSGAVDGSAYETLRFVVLDETAYENDGGFDWNLVKKYRVLQLGSIGDVSDNSPYQQNVFRDNNYDESEMYTPMYLGRTLDEIPFVFINSKDLITTPDAAPLQSVASDVLTIYRAEADYRQSLFMQGQDTLITVGGIRNANAKNGEADAIRTGSGSRIDLEMGGDAKFIGVSSSGLAEQRMSLENDYKRAEMKAGQLISSTGSRKESGLALRIRLAAQTATLNQIAMSAAAGLEAILKIAAKWIGANPDEVKVIPNMEFADFELNGDELLKLTQAAQQGAPISMETIHALMTDRGITKLSFEQELASRKNDTYNDDVTINQPNNGEE